MFKVYLPWFRAYLPSEAVSSKSRYIWFRAYLPWFRAYLPWFITYLPSEAMSSNPRRWLHYRGRPDACLQFTTDASKMVFMWSPSVFHHEGIENNYEVRRFMVSSAAQDESQFEVQYFVMATTSGQGALRTNKRQPVHRSIFVMRQDAL